MFYSSFGVETTKNGGKIFTLSARCIGAARAGVTPPMAVLCTHDSFICLPCKMREKNKSDVGSLPQPLGYWHIGSICVTHYFPTILDSDLHIVKFTIW